MPRIKGHETLPHHLESLPNAQILCTNTHLPMEIRNRFLWSPERSSSSNTLHKQHLPRQVNVLWAMFKVFSTPQHVAGIRTSQVSPETSEEGGEGMTTSFSLSKFGSNASGNGSSNSNAGVGSGRGPSVSSNGIAMYPVVNDRPKTALSCDVKPDSAARRMIIRLVTYVVEG